VVGGARTWVRRRTIGACEVHVVVVDRTQEAHVLETNEDAVLFVVVVDEVALVVVSVLLVHPVVPRDKYP